MRARQTIMMATLVALAPLSSVASTFFVAADGTGDLPTIQDAINASADGDTILLGDGVFSGDGNRGVYVDSDVVVRSISGDPSLCIVDCGGGPGESHTGFFADDGTTTFHLEGLTVTNGYMGEADPFGSAVWIGAFNSFTIENCLLVGNVGTTVRASGLGTVPAVLNSVIAGNAGLGVSVAAALVVSGSTITANSGGGIGIGSAAILEIDHSVIWGNCHPESEWPQIFANDGSVLIECCVVDSSGVGSFQPGHVAYVGNNVFINPYFCDPASCEDAPTELGDYHVDAISPCLPPNNPCSALIGALGVNCTGATPTVETSWSAIKSQYRE